MAIVTDNDLTSGLRGKLGKLLVFRSLRGKTFVSHRAAKPDKTKETTAQRQTRVTFREASAWAKEVLLDARRKVYYQSRARALKLPNAYTAAIADYMRKPQITKSQRRGMITWRIIKPGFRLSNVHAVLPDDGNGQQPIKALHLSGAKSGLPNAWEHNSREQPDLQLAFRIIDDQSRELVLTS